MLAQIFEVGFVLIVFIGVLFLTYYVTKKVASFNKQMHPNKNMEIVEVLPVMQGQYLYIIKVSKAYHLVGCSQKGNISYMCELKAEDLEFQEQQQLPFKEQLMELMKKRKGEKS